jgi:simple sugar transport system permease protein
MNQQKKRYFSYELVLFLLLVAFAFTIGLFNPTFFSVGTLFDVINYQTIYILLALALLPVVILGGLDISFVAIAAFATFPAISLLVSLGYTGGIWLFYVLSVIVGIGVGLIIGWLVSTFKLGIFELSLGSASLIFGLLALVGGARSTSKPLPALAGWNMKWIMTVQSTVGRSGLHISFILIVIALIGTHLFLRYTTLGRGIYALGADKSVAIRTGLDTRKIYLVAFSIMGAMSAVAGVTNAGLGLGNLTFASKYMRVYATVIIGGASVHGGKGSAIGTLMGVLLVGLINQALVYLRIPTAWGDAFLGAVFILFTIYQTLEKRINI